MPDPQAKKRCFVLMGFGIKTDYATGRKLDLDKSYRLLIKPVVEKRGLECVRADEIRHSGAIDVPMYEQLLTADVAIADLSTANPNALYELGIRHALRPHTTIVISEKLLPYPFDLNHIAITSYTHLGEAIDYDEVLRFQEELGKTLDEVLRAGKTDSPVYTFLQDLTPPLRGGASPRGAQPPPPPAAGGVHAVPEERTRREGGHNPTVAALVAQGEQAIKRDDFASAKAIFGAAVELSKRTADGVVFTYDPYLLQRLVLATYKSRQPDKVSALKEALTILDRLGPHDSNDAETVGLAGAIEKRLFEETKATEHLGRAIAFYSRGYHLRNDWYNGINLAFLLNVRTDTDLDPTTEEVIADLVWANRIRREVLALCERDLVQIRERRERMVGAAPDAESAALKEEQTARDQEQEFWCLATRGEALFGMGEMEAFRRTRDEAQAVPHAGWMMTTFEEQIARLKGLLDTHGRHLNPPWPANP